MIRRKAVSVLVDCRAIMTTLQELRNLAQVQTKGGATRCDDQGLLATMSFNGCGTWKST